MTTQQLHERPNLEQLKRQAKDRCIPPKPRKPSTLTRFRALPALSPGKPTRNSFCAQLAFARRHNRSSPASMVSIRGPRCAKRVEELTLQFAEAVDEFCPRRHGRPEHPGRTVCSRCIRRLRGRIFIPRWFSATPRRIDARARGKTCARHRSGRPARLGTAALCLPHVAAPRRTGATQTVSSRSRRRLLALGADANARFPWLHHGVRRPVLWGAACHCPRAALVQALLEAGANPNDGVTLPLVTGKQ